MLYMVREFWKAQCYIIQKIATEENRDVFDITVLVRLIFIEIPAMLHAGRNHYNLTLSKRFRHIREQSRALSCYYARQLPRSLRMQWNLQIRRKTDCVIYEGKLGWLPLRRNGEG